MKKLFTLLFVLAAVLVSAQSVNFTYNGAALAHNDTIVITYSADELGDFIQHPRVGYACTNAAETQYRVFKTNVSVISDNEIQFCIGDQCVGDTSGVFALLPGESITEDSERAFHANFFPFVAGTDVVKFTFQNVADPTDLSSFYVVFTVETGVANVTTTSLNAYPNPATTGVTIEYAGAQENAVVVLQNLTGAVVCKQRVDNSGKTFINTSALKPGVYFYGIQSKGQMTSVKKLVVK